MGAAHACDFIGIRCPSRSCAVALLRGCRPPEVPVARRARSAHPRAACRCRSAARASSHTTTTLICAPDNRAATSTSRVSAGKVSSRERVTASMPLISKGAAAPASAAATGGLSETTSPGGRGVGSVIAQGQLQAALCSSRNVPSDRADGPHCEAEARFAHLGLGGSASHHADPRTCR